VHLLLGKSKGERVYAGFRRRFSSIAQKRVVKARVICYIKEVLGRKNIGAIIAGVLLTTSRRARPEVRKRGSHGGARRRLYVYIEVGNGKKTVVAEGPQFNFAGLQLEENYGQRRDLWSPAGLASSGDLECENKNKADDRWVGIYTLWPSNRLEQAPKGQSYLRTGIS